MSTPEPTEILDEERNVVRYVRRRSILAGFPVDAAAQANSRSWVKLGFNPRPDGGKRCRSLYHVSIADRCVGGPGADIIGTGITEDVIERFYGADKPGPSFRSRSPMSVMSSVMRATPSEAIATPIAAILMDSRDDVKDAAP